jgi:hypothetical protein
MIIQSQTLISDTNVKLIELISTIYNVMLLAFYRAIDQSKTIFNLVNGFIDEYEDESGIDTAASTNESYNSTDDYYSPISAEIDSYTKLLLHLDNNVTDSETTPKIVTNNGVTFSSSIKKIGSYSGYFNGSSYLSAADSTDWEFGTGDFTLDCWFYCTDTTGYKSILSHYYNTSGSTGWILVVLNGNLGFWSFDLAVSMGNITAVSASTWYHVAVVRNSGTVKVYLNGILQATQVVTWNDSDNNQQLLVGKYSDIWSDGNFIGYIDEVRISKGIARWTSNFTPPSVSYGSLENMTLISNAQNAADVPTSARIVLFEEDVDAITLNTDLKAYISRDGGTTFTQVTLTNEGYYATSKNILAGLVDISSQPSGDDVKYKIETLNLKNLKLHGTGINWA